MKKIEDLKPEQIREATRIIDTQGVPKKYVWSQYYVLVDEKEYPFKYLVKVAYSLVFEGKIQFQSNDLTRGYIKNLGFKFNYYEGGYNFFTKEELSFYESIHNEDYRKNNPDQTHYGNKLYPINKKLRYWLEQIIPNGYKIRYDGKWLGVNSKVSPYLWPRIYKGEDKDVFFNVEVAAYDKFIGFKLDGYYSTTKKLQDYKIDLLDEFKNNPKNSWYWLKIPFSELYTYNWDRLILESKKYLSDQILNHDYLKELLSKESKIARVTWNTNNWVKPSGLQGKSKNSSFESENGFGHEEWIFDGDKIINDYKYGFLEPIHKHRDTYEDKTFDISLYTRDGDLKKNYWVTTLKEVQVISSKEAKEVLARYKENGWYDEMKLDLYNLNLNYKQLDDWTKDDASQLFNIKFNASQINELPTELTPIIDENHIPSSRYNLMNISVDLQKEYKQQAITKFSFENTGSEDADLEAKGKRKNNRNEIELEFKHNILQQKFLKYLQIKFGKSNIKRECKAFGSSRIDITQKTSTGFIFYEIKTYNSLRYSIRECIGQLFEYCFYPDVIEAKKIVLVSHIEPSEEIKTYLNHIKKRIKIPFSYIHFDIEKEKIILEI